MATQQGHRLIRNSIFTLFNTFFVMATSWVISIWVARQLGPTNYGIFSLVLWLSGTFSWAVGMGLIHAVTKFVAEYEGRCETDSLAAVIRLVIKIELVLTTVATAILVFFRLPIADFFFSPTESFYFFLSFVGLIPGVLTAILSASVEGLQKFQYFTLANLIVTPFSFAAKVFVLWMGWGITGLLSVMLIFSFVNLLYYSWVLRKEGIHLLKGKPLDKSLRSRIMRYNTSVAAILLSDKIVWDKSENFFLGRLCTAAEVGFYNLGFNVSRRFTSILPETFWRVLFPAMSNYFGSGSREKMVRLFFVTTRYLAFFTFPVGVAGMILSYQILHYLYGHDYVQAQRTLQILFVSSIFSSLSNPASAVLYGYERQSFIYKYGFILAGINLVMDIILIPRYGAMGAAVCYGITTVLGSIGGLIYTCRTMKLQYPFASVFKILFATIMMGTVMEIVLLRDREIFGSLFALAAGTVVYLVSALVLGTFEQEDYSILESAKKVLPGRMKGIVDWAIGFIAQFKNSSSPSSQ